MLVLLLASALAAAPSWTVTVDPLTTALGYVHLQIEGVASDRVSVYGGPHMRLFDGVLTEGHEPFLGVGVELGVRYFPWGGAPEGGWLMARTVTARLWTTEPPNRAKFGGYSSVLFGYTGVVGKHLVLSGGAGFNYLYYDIEGYGSKGPFPALHTNLGVAF